MESPSVQERVQGILAPFAMAQGSLIPVLQAVQAELGYLPEEAMREVAEHLGIPESSVYGVASFYAQFRFTPAGRKVLTVCRGTACHVRGSGKVLEEIGSHLGIDEGETTPDGEYSLETVACIGCCALAPCAVFDGKTEARLSTVKVRALLAKADEHEL